MTIFDFLCVDDSMAAIEFWVIRRMAMELRKQEREDVERLFKGDGAGHNLSLLEDSELIQ